MIFGINTPKRMYVIMAVFLPCSRERGADEQETQHNTVQHDTTFVYKSNKDAATLLVTG